MLAAIPRQNQAATVVRQPDGSARVTVPLIRPRWLIPPLSWVVKPASQRRFLMNPPAAVMIWEHCDGQRNVESIIEVFARRYRLTFHEARVAVMEYIRTLVQRGILAIEPVGHVPRSGLI